MPELPDVTIYLESLQRRIVGQRLERVSLENPFLLRTAEPPLQSSEGRKVIELRRVGKRIAIGLEGDLWLLIHLMIAGRLHWYDKAHTGRLRPALLQLEFSNGTLTLTEAGTKRRASLHVLSAAARLSDHDRGGLEVLGADPDEFRARMSERNHTLKRALTDPTILSGVGNAYSDELLHRARLSPLLQTKQMSDADWQALYDATQATLIEWIERLRTQPPAAFRKKSPPSTRKWPSTAATATLARCVRPQSRESATPRTKRTIAHAVRPAASCSPTGRCRACSRRIGRGRSMPWRT